MYLLKTRAVPVSQWKTGNKKDKDYYLPAFYSSQKKGPSNKSAHLKNEDFVWEGVQTVRIKNAGRPPLAEYVIGSLLCCFGEESAYEKVFWLAYQKSKKIIDAHPTSVKYIFLAVIVWNYLEIVVHPHSEAACTFLKNMGLTQICQTIINYGLSSVWMFFHSLYHCVLDNSLLNAAGFLPCLLW